jgi:hypothetical protein
MDANFFNFVAYWVNGIESSVEIHDLSLATELGLSVGDEVDNTPLDAVGFRLGVSPISLFEIGTSFASGWNDDHRTEMTIWGLDGQLDVANFVLKTEFIVNQKNKSISRETDKGFYAQALYSFGKPFATARYGGTSFEGVNDWAETVTLGAGYALVDGAEVRVEYLINDGDVSDNLALQWVVGF